MMASTALRSSSRRVLSASRRLFSTEGFPPYILNAPATEVSPLSNGLRVASEGGHGETATVGVFIDAGSRIETPENNGVAHFLEHLTFKGTAARSQANLEKEIENMGGHLNAYTSREHTVFYAQVFKQDVPKAMEILGDMLLNPELDKNAVELERNTILRELHEVQSQTEEVVFDSLHETAFAGSGLGQTILGPKKNIETITAQQLRDYIDTNYVGTRMVVAGAGAVDHQQLSDLAEQHFGALPSASTAGSNNSEGTPRFTGSDLRFRDDAMPLAHVAVAVEAAGATSAHQFPLAVMQTLLGSWDRTSNAGTDQNSELAQATAAGNLAHSFHAFNSAYKDTGLFGIYYVAEQDKVQDMALQATDHMVRLCHSVSEEELARAKAQLKASMLMALDNSASTCDEIGRHLLTYGRRISPAEIFARIDAVDVEAIWNTARTFIDDKEPAVAAVGPLHELPDYNWWRRHTYWLRY